MTTDIARLEREIAAERAELLANLALLEDRARALTDWRRQVRQRPLAAVGVAAAGGLLLAILTDARPRRTASPTSDGADGGESARPGLRSHPIVDRIVSTLAAVAAERAFAALGISMPSAADEAENERDTRATTRDSEPRASARDRAPRASARERETHAGASARDREPPSAGEDG